MTPRGHECSVMNPLKPHCELSQSQSHRRGVPEGAVTSVSSEGATCSERVAAHDGPGRLSSHLFCTIRTPSKAEWRCRSALFLPYSSHLPRHWDFQGSLHLNILPSARNPKLCEILVEARKRCLACVAAIRKLL